MRKITTLALVALLSVGQVQAEAFRAPDILIDSKLDFDFSGLLVSKFRMLLKNYKMKDPFVGEIKEAIVIKEDDIGEYLSGDSKTLMRDFGNAVGLNFIQADTKVSIHGFAYNVKGFSTNLKAQEQTVDGLIVGTDFSADQVNLSADKISLSLVIPGKNNSPIFNVDIINPEITASEEKLINFFTKIKIQDNADHFKLQIKQANFDKMARGLLSRPQNVELNYDRVEIPKVSLKVGNKTVNFSQAKIQNLLRENHNAIKGLLLAQIASTLKSNTTEAAFKVLEQFKVNKEFWMNTSIIDSQFKISQFSSTLSGDNLQIDMPGDFCTSQKFKLFKKDCVNNKSTKTSLSRITPKLHKDSVQNMKDLMDRGEANIVASISEDYLNKLIVATYDAGLWKSTLDENGITLGDNKMTLQLGKRGDSGTLIMDVVYTPSKMERLFTGSKQIRFPLIMDVAIRIEKHDGEPVVIIRLNGLDTTDETLINGNPKANIISTVKDIPRFKNKVAATIREKLAGLNNKDIIELRYPEFKGLGLEKVDFLSDGNGRMNAIMSLEDLLQESDS